MVLVEDFSQKLDAMLKKIHHDHPKTGLVTVVGAVGDTPPSVVKDKVVLHIGDRPREFPTAVEVYYLRP